MLYFLLRHTHTKRLFVSCTRCTCETRVNRVLCQRHWCDICVQYQWDEARNRNVQCTICNRDNIKHYIFHMDDDVDDDDDGGGMRTSGLGIYQCSNTVKYHSWSVLKPKVAHTHTHTPKLGKNYFQWSFHLGVIAITIHSAEFNQPHHREHGDLKYD